MPWNSSNKSSFEKKEVITEKKIIFSEITSHLNYMVKTNVTNICNII